jgi:hypothetical protein
MQQFNDKINVFSARVKAGGLSLPNHQAVFHPTSLKHEVGTIPSTSQPNWAGYFILDYKEKNNTLDNLSVVLKVSPLELKYKDGSLYGGSSAFIPAFMWFNRIEFVQNNIILDTYYPSQQFILNQIIHDDVERLTINNLAGNYASRAQRVRKSSMTTDYHIHLRTIIDQTKLSVLELHDEIQLRIYLQPLTDVVDYFEMDIEDILNTTPSATIQSASLIAKHTKLNQSGLHLSHVKDRKKQAHSSIFHDVRYSLTNITMAGTGIQQFNIVLSSLVGSVAALFFTIRNTSTLKNEGSFYFLDFFNFDILDSAGASLVGGTPVSYSQNQKLLAEWSRSTYTEENIYNANLVGQVVDNGANIGCWSFSDDPIQAIKHGRALSSHKFSGNEVLRLTIDSNTAYYTKQGIRTPDRPGGISNVYQIDIYAFTENLHSASGFDIKKFAI